MAIPHVTSFCWCMGLEMGSKFIGFVHLAVSVALLVLSSMYAEGSRAYIGTMADADEHIYSAFYKMAVGGAVMASLHVLLAITLLYSAYKRNTVGLRVWVWVMALLFVASLLYIIVQSALTGFSTSGSNIFVALLQGLVLYSILSYCILCVNSYYLMLRSSEDMEGPNKTYY